MWDNSRCKSCSKQSELDSTSNEWLDDRSMVSEVEKLTDELKNRRTSFRKVLDGETTIDVSEPQIVSDYKTEVKDGVKEFEIDGQKYRRKYQRKINLEKHSVKQYFTFTGDENSILDIDIGSECATTTSDQSSSVSTTATTSTASASSTPVSATTVDNDVFHNINSSCYALSPRIVIRSINKSPYNNTATRKNNVLFEDSILVESNDGNLLDESSFASQFLNLNQYTSTTIMTNGLLPESVLSIDKKLSKDLRHSFLAQWQKSESCSLAKDQNANTLSPTTFSESHSASHIGKTKTISCVERFNTKSERGSILHGSTCVQLTRSLLVRPASTSDSLKEKSDEAVKPAKLIIEEPLLFKVDVTKHLIYNEKFDPLSENACKHISISAGELDALIAHACSIGINATSDYHLFHKVFVVTYRLFISTGDLINKLIARYKYFSEDKKYPNDILQEFQEELSFDVNDNIREDLLTAIVNLLIEIIKQWNRPVDEDIYEEIQIFCGYLTSRGGIKQTLLVNSALRDVNNRIKLQETKSAIIREQKCQYLTNMQLKRTSTSKTILDFDSKIFAEQITLLEAEIFDRINLEDLLNFKSAVQNPNLMNCVHFFNNLTYWTKTQLFADIGERNTIIDREKRVLKFLEIIRILKSHQNYSSYTSILYSLIDFPDKLLSKKTKQKLTEESEFMSLSNKRQYLEAIHSAEPPFIPLLADIFSHLTRLNEIMPTLVKPSALSHADSIKTLDSQNTSVSTASTTDSSTGDSTTITSINRSTNKLVNFKKMWNYFIIIQFFIKKTELSYDRRYYQFKFHPETLAFIDNFSNCYTEAQLFSCRELLMRTKSKKYGSSSSSGSNSGQNATTAVTYNKSHFYYQPPQHASQQHLATSATTKSNTNPNVASPVTPAATPKAAGRSPQRITQIEYF